MSICRFSDDNMKSDIYLYECWGGYSMNIRSPYPMNTEDMKTDGSFEEMLKYHEEELYEQWKEQRREDVSGLHWEERTDWFAGKSFSFDYGHEKEMMSILWLLEEYGYHVPPKAFITLGYRTESL